MFFNSSDNDQIKFEKDLMGLLYNKAEYDINKSKRF